MQIQLRFAVAIASSLLFIAGVFAQSPSAQKEALPSAELKHENALNAALLERELARDAKRPAGRWLSDDGMTTSKALRVGRALESTVHFVAQDGSQHTVTSHMEPDLALGALVLSLDGKPARMLRVTAIDNDGYTLATLPGLGISPEQARNETYRIAQHDDVAETFGPDGQRIKVTRFVPDEVAIATLATRASENRVEAERKAQAEAKERAEFLARVDALARAEADAREASWGADEDDYAPTQPNALQVLQGELAKAQASEARSRASLDNTMAQAAEQAAWERQMQSQREQAQAQQDYARQAELARQATQRQQELARQFAAQQQSSQSIAQQPTASRAPSGNAGGAVTGEARSSAPAEGGPWFVYCVAVKPGAYLDAPGAVFLSDISALDSLSAYNAGAFAESFGAAVSAKYGTTPGSASCNAMRSRADAQRRRQEQRDSAGLTAYRKVETGLPAAR